MSIISLAEEVDNCGSSLGERMGRGGNWRLSVTLTARGLGLALGLWGDYSKPQIRYILVVSFLILKTVLYIAHWFHLV